MLIEPIILDNLIPESFQKEVHTAITTQTTWQYEPATSMGSKESGNFIQGYDVFQDAMTIDCPQFTHFAMLNGQSSPAFPALRPMLYFVEKRLNRRIDSIGRVKINCTTRNGPRFTENNYNIPHVDATVDNLLTMIYYVNDSDGDTFLFNESHEQGRYISGVSLKQRVTPKMGRAVIFDAKRFHAGSNPINESSRFVINFTFTLEDEKQNLETLGQSIR